MNIIVKKIFKKDAEKINDKKTLLILGELIDQIKVVNNISDISNIKKMKGFDNYYRIKLGDYRLGFKYEDENIYLMRILHRKDIYRFFP